MFSVAQLRQVADRMGIQWSGLTVEELQRAILDRAQRPPEVAPRTVQEQKFSRAQLETTAGKLGIPVSQYRLLDDTALQLLIVQTHKRSQAPVAQGAAPRPRGPDEATIRQVTDTWREITRRLIDPGPDNRPLRANADNIERMKTAVATYLEVEDRLTPAQIGLVEALLAVLEHQRSTVYPEELSANEREVLWALVAKVHQALTY